MKVKLSVEVKVLILTADVLSAKVFSVQFSSLVQCSVFTVYLRSATEKFLSCVWY